MEKEIIRTPVRVARSNPHVKMASVDLILDRLKCHFEAQDDAALSKKLGFSRGLVSNWRKRNTMAYRYVIKIALHEGLSLDFLFSDKE
ncbi:helix-turn-helix domain-containing protein [Vibrio mediterranei]